MTRGTGSDELVGAGKGKVGTLCVVIMGWCGSWWERVGAGAGERDGNESGSLALRCVALRALRVSWFPACRWWAWWAWWAGRALNNA